MADQATLQADPPFPPPVLSGKELYDSIMGPIEPELLSANLPFAPDAFAGETPEQRAERAQRYASAFEEYDRRLAAHTAQWNEQLRSYKRHAMEYIEGKARGGEERELETIESSLLADQ